MAPLSPEQDEQSAEAVMKSLLHVSAPADEDAEFDGENLVISNALAIGWVRWSRIACVLHVESDGIYAKAGIKQKYWLMTVDGCPLDSITPEEVAAALRKGASLGFTAIPPWSTPTQMDKPIEEGIEGGIEEDLFIKAKEQMSEEPSMAREEAGGIAKDEDCSPEGGTLQTCQSEECNTNTDQIGKEHSESTQLNPSSLGAPKGAPPLVPKKEEGEGEPSTPCKAIPNELTKPRLPFAPPPLSELKKKRSIPKRHIVLKANASRIEHNDPQLCESRFPVPNSLLAALIDKGLTQEELPPPPPPDYRRHRSRRRHSHDYEDDHEANRLNRSLLGDSERRKRRRREGDQEAPAPDSILEQANAVPQRRPPARESRQPQEGSECSASVETDKDETVELVWKTFGNKSLHQIIKELNERQRRLLREHGVLDVLQGNGSIRRMPLKPRSSMPTACNTVWVGWFGPEVRAADIKVFFERCGPVRRVFKADSFAHVHYDEPFADRSVQAAIELSGELLLRDPIRVEYRDVKGWIEEERRSRDQQHSFNRQGMNPRRNDWFCSACGVMNYYYRDVCLKCQANKFDAGWTMAPSWHPSSSTAHYGHRFSQPGVQPIPHAVIPRSLGNVDMPPQPLPAVMPSQPEAQPFPQQTTEAWGPWEPPTWIRQPPSGSPGATVGSSNPGPPAHHPHGSNVGLQYWQYPHMPYDSSPSYTDMDSYYSDSSSSSSISSRRRGKRSRQKRQRSSKAGLSITNAVVPKVPAETSAA